MPDTGYSPYGEFDPGGVVDMSGGGADSSYAWSLAPGGRFPGDDYYSSEYRSGLDTGGAYGNPDYRLPPWLAATLGHSRVGSLLSRHESNVRSPGAGQAVHDAGAAGSNHFFSGPGAAYGPATGPTRGLVDQGRPPGEAWDGPELRPPGGTEAGKPGKGKGKGGSQAGHFTYSPYQGIQQHAQFVDWQPTAFGEQPSGPTRFVGGAGSSTPGGSAAPPAGTRGQGGKGGKGDGKGPAGGPAAGGGRGAGSGQGQGAGGPGGRPGANSGQGGGPGQGAYPPVDGGAVAQGGHFRPSDNKTPFNASTYGGVDTNNLDYRTPSWMRDPTTSVMYTSGFPNATPFAPTSGHWQTASGATNQPIQGFDSYVTSLHDAGFTTDDIMSLVGPYGYRQDGSGNWEWGWGTGPVVSNGENGGNYSFANGSGPSSGGAGDGFSPGPFWAGGTYQNETDHHGSSGQPSLFANLARTGNASGAPPPSAGGGGATNNSTAGVDSLASSAAFFHGSDI